MWPTVAAYVWESHSWGARSFRAMLTPASRLFGMIVARRNRRYDARPASRTPLVPAMSIGNLTVGGTGKTPIAAWCVEQLRARGAKPAIVMRGVGDDEWRVHGLLNPTCPVIVSADRVAGMIAARAQGADCVVLDDAFQHRRAPRLVDLVLLSADRWTGDAYLLPIGPFREPMSALRRASLVVVTAKAASSSAIDDVVSAVTAEVPQMPVVVVRLVPGALRLAATVGARHDTSKAGQPRREWLTHPPTWLSGRSIHVLSAIGDPTSFEGQLRQLGAVLAGVHRFADHHAFSDREIKRVANDAANSDGVVCTLKDAVKLTVRWPRAAPPLWYLSQTVTVDRGADVLERACDQLLAARAVSVLHPR